MRSLFFLLVSINCLCSQAQELPHLEEQKSPVNASLRGLSVISEQVVWASGTGGSFLKTIDGGENWVSGTVRGADSLDFRDIQAFSASEALLASAGQPARVYRTEDGGKSWQKVYEDSTGEAFFDAMAFWDTERGLLMSDPVKGNFLLLSTRNGGKSWQQIDPEKLPAAKEGEAGFAASGSGLTVVSPQLALFGTGGPVVRVFRSTDGGESWQAHNTPLTAETASTGIYSMDMKNSSEGVAVGGDYTQPAAKENHLLLSRDGGRSWERIDHSGLGGYRSGVAYQPFSSGTYIAVGTNGMDLSFDGGKRWQPLSTIGMHAIRFAPSGKTAWASGANGRLIKIVFN